MTITQPVVQTDRTRFEELYSTLSEDEKLMFVALEQDARRALDLSKPLLGIFRRRGQYHFVILRKSCKFMREFEKARIHTSSLVLDKEKPITIQTLKKLLGLLKLKGFRANGLEEHAQCIRLDIDYPYFEYHIDLEAA